MQRALNAPGPVREFVREHDDSLSGMPAQTLIQLAQALIEEPSSKEDIAMAKRLYANASKTAVSEAEIRLIAVGLVRVGDEFGALNFLNSQMARDPNVADNPSVLRTRANVLVKLGHLDPAERDLHRALTLSSDPAVREAIQSVLSSVTLARQRASSLPSPS